MCLKNINPFYLRVNGGVNVSELSLLGQELYPLSLLSDPPFGGCYDRLNKDNISYSPFS